MNVSLQKVEWSLVEAFQSVAETGSLSEAGRRLGISQPTVGRQIKELEAQLSVTLFHRKPRGYEMTDAARALIPHAQTMHAAAHAFALTAAGQSDRLSGPVRITASEFMAHHHLPAILAKLRHEEPEISIDLIASDQSDNLLFREADIAVRMYRSGQLDIVTRHLGDMALGAYAAKSYIARKGMPEGFDDMQGHDMIGYDRSDLILQGMRSMGLPATRDWFAVRTDAQPTYWQLVRQGAGIGFAQCAVADKDPDVVPVWPFLELPKLPLWLATHESLRNVPRVRRVWQALEQGLKPLVS